MYVAAANALNNPKASGTEISNEDEYFVAQYAGDPVTSADSVALIFWIVVIATVLMSLWMPKSS